MRQELREDRSKLADDVGDVHVVLDRKDQADLMIQAGVDDAELTRDLTELAQIEAALRRLDTGRFGLCEDCAEPIAAQDQPPHARLQRRVLRVDDVLAAAMRQRGPLLIEALLDR